MVKRKKNVESWTLERIDGNDNNGYTYSMMRKSWAQMATPKWFLVALSQCRPDKIAAADPPAFHDEQDEEKDEDEEELQDVDDDYDIDVLDD